ncbi:hypothetical protein QCA50_011745 [Cerrena zonata]|uniref:Uncharacterized protein n=1 Tax=Cerrena zonata TaxID=2478898 RepID=A0AAW0FVI9_9APHY
MAQDSIGRVIASSTMRAAWLHLSKGTVGQEHVEIVLPLVCSRSLQSVHRSDFFQRPLFCMLSQFDFSKSRTNPFQTWPLRDRTSSMRFEYHSHQRWFTCFLDWTAFCSSYYVTSSDRLPGLELEV